MMTSALFAARSPSSCRTTHRKKHSARYSISVLIRQRLPAKRPAVMQHQQKTASRRKIRVRRITCSGEAERLHRLILQRLLRSQSRRASPQHRRSRLRGIPGILPISIRRNSALPPCRVAHKNTDRDMRLICRVTPNQMQCSRAGRRTPEHQMRSRLLQPGAHS